MKTKRGSWVLYAALCLAVAFLPTCGGGGGSGEASNQTGSLSVMLHVENQQTSSLAQIDCGATGVDSVEAHIYDQANTLLASGGPWNCALHQGTVTGVPAECGILVVAVARDVEGTISYLGEVPGVCVQADQTTSVGVTLLPWDSPIPLAPPADNYTKSEPTAITFQWSSNRERHVFQLDNNSDYSSPEIDTVVFGTSYTRSLNNGTYYWRVRATDSTGNFETYWYETFFALHF